MGCTMIGILTPYAQVVFTHYLQAHKLMCLLCFGIVCSFSFVALFFWCTEVFVNFLFVRLANRGEAQSEEDRKKSRKERRIEALATRRIEKRLFRKHARCLRRLKKVLTCIEERYGYFAALLCRPEVMHKMLLLHRLLHIGYACWLGMDLTSVLEEAWLAFLLKNELLSLEAEALERFINKSPTVTWCEDAYKYEKKVSLYVQRVEEEKSWRLLLEPWRLKRVHRSRRRCIARLQRANLLIRRALYLTTLGTLSVSSFSSLDEGGSYDAHCVAVAVVDGEVEVFWVVEGNLTRSIRLPDWSYFAQIGFRKLAPIWLVPI